MNTKYDVDYFIKKFSSFPLQMWGKGVLNSKITGEVCALGQCGLVDYHEPNKESIALVNILKQGDFYQNFKVNDNSNLAVELELVYTLNDGRSYYDTYKEGLLHFSKTPKARILAALQDIKDKLEPKQEQTLPKIIYKVVKVDSSIIDKAEEIVLNHN